MWNVDDINIYKVGSAYHCYHGCWILGGW